MEDLALFVLIMETLAGMTNQQALCQSASDWPEWPFRLGRHAKTNKCLLFIQRGAARVGFMGNRAANHAA
jgi:hypothetical protein